MINLDKNHKYLLACSFGPDSMALFDMLKKENINFSVAHVNYNLRPESVKETSDLISYCKKENVEIFVDDIHTDINKNIEEKCREMRYNFFKKLYIQNSYDALLVAHNEDDNIETYYLQQKRKNLVLFYGISCKSSLFSMNVIRPLLGLKKSFLLNYCKENKVPYAIDSTNLQDCFLRNQIRHNVVEKLSDCDRLKIINEINDKNSQLKSMLKIVDNFDSEYICDLIKLDRDIFPYILNRLARKIKSDAEISRRLCDEVIKALKSDKPNVLVRIKNNFCFYKEYDKFKFDFIKPISYRYTIKHGDIINNEYFFFDTNFEIEKRNLKVEDFPIVVSNPESDDCIKINGYYVKLRRLFIDWKMPISLREKWPVIRNKFNEIVYVPRYQKDFKPSSSTSFYVKI